MADKQTVEDKEAAYREYRQHQESVVERTAVLRLERLQREAAGTSSMQDQAASAPRRKRSPGAR